MKQPWSAIRQRPFRCHKKRKKKELKGKIGLNSFWQRLYHENVIAVVKYDKNRKREA